MCLRLENPDALSDIRGVNVGTVGRYESEGVLNSFEIIFQRY